MKLTILALAGAVVAQNISCPAIPKAATPEEMRKGVPIKPEDVPTGCSPLEVLIARGTGEGNSPDVVGKFGIVVGDPLIGNLTIAIPGVRGYPVQYPASGNISLAAIGADDVANRLSKQAAACPDQKFVLVGYSQGAAVMRAAASKRIAKELYPKIIALVMYGDGGFKGNSPSTFSDLGPLFTGGSASKGSPMEIFGTFPDALEEKLLQNCAPGDPVCDTCGCFYHHLQYISKSWVNRSVEHIVAAFKGQGKKGNISGIGIDNKLTLGQWCKDQPPAAKSST